MPTVKPAPKKTKFNLRHQLKSQPQRQTNTADPPVVNVPAEDWGTNADPWPATIDESDVSKEIVSVWRQNVYAAENGGELQKMEDLYDRLDREREKWDERLKNPHTWGWGGERDDLNDWARHSTNEAVHEPHHWVEQQQARSDKTPDGLSSARHPEVPPPLHQLLSSYADKLKAGGRRRSYAFAQLSPEAKAKKIREIAYQLKEESKY